MMNVEMVHETGNRDHRIFLFTSFLSAPSASGNVRYLHFISGGFFVQRAGKPAGNGFFGPCNKTGVHIRKRRSAETVNPVKVTACRTVSAADCAGF